MPEENVVNNRLMGPGEHYGIVLRGDEYLEPYELEPGHFIAVESGFVIAMNLVTIVNYKRIGKVISVERLPDMNYVLTILGMRSNIDLSYMEDGSDLGGINYDVTYYIRKIIDNSSIKLFTRGSLGKDIETEQELKNKEDKEQWQRRQMG